MRSLVVARAKGSAGLFIVLLVDVHAGCILESSHGLSEPEIRKVLAESYGQTDAQIRTRLELAKSHDEI